MSLPADAPTVPLSPQQRRERNRREMVDAILDAARAVMQAHGVAALNLNEVARRVRLRPQSLAEYFPSKAALYDELFQRAVYLFHDGDARAYREHPPGWGQVEAWFVNRIALAYAHPDLYHLLFSAPVPDLRPTERSVEATRETLVGARQMVAEAVTAGAMAPGMAPERATDLLMAIRHGLIAEHLGKRAVLPTGSERFSGLVPDVVRMLQAAWTPAPRPERGAP